MGASSIAIAVVSLSLALVVLDFVVHRVKHRQAAEDIEDGPGERDARWYDSQETQP